MNGKLRNMTSIYLTKGDKILLLYRQGSSVVNQLWIGSAGGHFEEFELNDPEACILREMHEELGLSSNEIENLSLRYITIRRAKDEIRQNYFFFAKIKNTVDENLLSNEGISKWFHVDELQELEMPFSAKNVIKHYLAISKDNDKVYGGVANGEEVIFTELIDF